METFQDLSLPIPGKEDLAKLHSAIYQNVPAKPGTCGDSHTAQGWLAFIVEYIRRYATFRPPGPGPPWPGLPGTQPGRRQTLNRTVQGFVGVRAESRFPKPPCARCLLCPPGIGSSRCAQRIASAIGAPSQMRKGGLGRGDVTL